MARAAKQRQTSRFVIALSSVKHGFASKTKSLSNIRCHQTTYSLRGLNPRPMAHKISDCHSTTRLRIRLYSKQWILGVISESRFLMRHSLSSLLFRVGSPVKRVESLAQIPETCLCEFGLTLVEYGQTPVSLGFCILPLNLQLT